MTPELLACSYLKVASIAWIIVYGPVGTANNVVAIVGDSDGSIYSTLDDSESSSKP